MAGVRSRSSSACLPFVRSGTRSSRQSGVRRRQDCQSVQAQAVQYFLFRTRRHHRSYQAHRRRQSGQAGWLRKLAAVGAGFAVQDRVIVRPSRRSYRIVVCLSVQTVPATVPDVPANRRPTYQPDRQASSGQDCQVRSGQEADLVIWISIYSVWYL